jgi:hypothetical protein
VIRLDKTQICYSLLDFSSHVCTLTVFLKVTFRLCLRGRAHGVLSLELLELSFLGLVLLGKAGNDLANLMKEQFMTSRILDFQRLTPSRFVCNAGTTSLTVLSTRTPPIRRKHFLSGSSASASFSVDRTKLGWGLGWMTDISTGHFKRTHALRPLVRVPQL